MRWEMFLLPRKSSLNWSKRPAHQSFFNPRASPSIDCACFIFIFVHVLRGSRYQVKNKYGLKKINKSSSLLPCLYHLFFRSFIHQFWIYPAVSLSNCLSIHQSSNLFFCSLAFKTLGLINILQWNYLKWRENSADLNIENYRIWAWIWSWTKLSYFWKLFTNSSVLSSVSANTAAKLASSLIHLFIRPSGNSANPSQTLLNQISVFKSSWALAFFTYTLNVFFRV